MTKEKIIKKLTEKQKKFCKIYATNEEFFCNGVKSYQKAYGTKVTPIPYETAKAGAYRLITNDHILDYLNSLIEEGGLNDAFVDKQLKKLINQDVDFTAKNTAIREYNKLKARIKEKKEVFIKDLRDASDEELNKLIDE